MGYSLAESDETDRPYRDPWRRSERSSLAFSPVPSKAIWYARAAALLSGLLLLTFGVAMTLALGVKAIEIYAGLADIVI